MSRWCERLEERMFLSAAPLAGRASINGTYTGTLHASASGAGKLPLSLSFSQSDTWPVSGTLTAAALGTLNFIGTPAGHGLRLVLAGSSAGAGEMIVRSGPHNTLHGTFVENFGDRSIRSTFQAAAASTPSTPAGGSIRIGKVRASQPNVTGLYQGITATGQSASLNIAGESASGLVGGALVLGKQTFTATGMVRGNEIDLVLAGGGTATFMRSGASISGPVTSGTTSVPLRLVNRAARRHSGRAGGSNGTASSTGSTSVSSGSSASLSGTTGITVSSPDASTSLVVSGLGQFVNIGSLTAFGSGAANPFNGLNGITSPTTSSTSIGVPGTGSTGVISSSTLPSSGNTNGSPTGTGSGFTTGVGASPPVGNTTTVPGTSSGVVGGVPTTPTTNPTSGGDLYGTPIYGTGSPGFK